MVTACSGINNNIKINNGIDSKILPLTEPKTAIETF